MRRRDFIKVIGGAAAVWPAIARAQQSVMPSVGLLDLRSRETVGDRLRGFRQGLTDNGYVEGDNVTIVYRWAENHIDRLPRLAEELASRQVTVIAATGGNHVATAVKAATTTIPIVSIMDQDPVKLGLVASLSRPGGNLTGINFFSGELSAKRLGLLRELVPGAARVAVLVNPKNAVTADSTAREVVSAARALGLQIYVLNASTSSEINAAFARLARERYDGLIIGSDAFLSSRRAQLVNLTVRHSVPAVFTNREFAEIGGLMSYGTNIVDVWRQVAVYVGRILKGAKPADLPVVQSSKFELVINAETARMLGLTVPPTLLALVDEVIE